MRKGRVTSRSTPARPPCRPVPRRAALLDPDGNGVELMVDRPAAEWPRRQDGGIAMRVDPLDLAGLVADAFEIDLRAQGG